MLHFTLLTLSPFPKQTNKQTKNILISTSSINMIYDLFTEDSYLCMYYGLKNWDDKACCVIVAQSENELYAIKFFQWASIHFKINPLIIRSSESLLLISFILFSRLLTLILLLDFILLPTCIFFPFFFLRFITNWWLCFSYCYPIAVTTLYIVTVEYCWEIYRFFKIYKIQVCNFALEQVLCSIKVHFYHELT